MQPALWVREPAAEAGARRAQRDGVMRRNVTLDVVEAYSLCPRKAFLLTTGAVQPKPHDYELLLREQAEANRHAYHDHLAKTSDLAPFGEPADLTAGREVFM